MTQEELWKVQKIWDKALKLISLARTIEMSDDERMDGITIGDMALLMEYVVALGKRRDELELMLEGVIWQVDKWLEGNELKKDPVSRAVLMREKTLKIAEQLDEARYESDYLQTELGRMKDIFTDIENKADIMQTPNGICLFIKADDYTEIKKKY